MKRSNGADGLDFEALRLCIERCDPDRMLGFFADEVELSIVDARFPQTPPFELRGKAEVAKHLRAVYGQGASHRVERVVLGDRRTTFREVCEYPDGDRVLVETTLELRDAKMSARWTRWQRSRGLPQTGPNAFRVPRLLTTSHERASLPKWHGGIRVLLIR